MFEDYSISKFVLAFFIVVLLIYGFYLFMIKYGQRFSIAGRGDIKIKDIKFFAKDKGFVIVKIKGEEYFFTFDSQNGLKLVKNWKEEKINEEELS